MFIWQHPPSYGSWQEVSLFLPFNLLYIKKSLTLTLVAKMWRRLTDYSGSLSCLESQFIKVARNQHLIEGASVVTPYWNVLHVPFNFGCQKYNILWWFKINYTTLLSFSTIGTSIQLCWSICCVVSF